MSNPRLLFIAHRIPYPPNKGDKIRSYNELLFLSRHFEIDLVCFIDDPKDAQYISKLEALCHSVAVFKRGPILKFFRLAEGFLQRGSLSVSIYNHDGLREKISQLISNRDYNHIFIFSGQMAQYVPRKLLARTVIDFCDVDSHKWDNYADRMPFYFSWFYRLEAKKLLAFENTFARLAQAAIFITDSELELFRQLGGKGNLLSLANGVDTGFFAPRNQIPETGRILFTGAMDYFPNEEGVVWFAKEVFEPLRKKFPALKFVIAGSNPTPKVKALGHIAGITVTGFVEDMREEQAKAHIVVVPLRIARGMQNKVLEAMACGKAVVVGKKAMGGIYATHGRDLMIAEEAQEFILAIESLLQNQTATEAMGKAAREYIVENFSWDKNLRTGLMALLNT